MVQLAAGLELAGRFRLGVLLGRGGSAEVWAATDLTTGTDIALRIQVARDDISAASLAVGLQADADRVARLAHPGIVRPLAVITDGCLACVAFELVDGGDLGALRGATHQAIVAAVREVTDALQYVHAQGLTHGDLKAGNVLRDRQGRWRLTDFRSAALPDPDAAVSLSTISPQQLAGAPATTADDIYSLGALLYDLLAGQPPLHPDITIERIRSEVPERLGVDGQGQPVPLLLTQLVGAMLEKSPARRPGSLGAVRALLAEIAGDVVRRPVPADSAAAPLRMKQRPGGHGAGRLPRLAIVGLVMLLAGVVAVLFWLPRVVRERTPPVVAVPRPSATPPAAAPAPPAENLRGSADTALAERVRAEDAARLAGADRWGGADWAEARRLAALGDGQYSDGDYAAAAASFIQATGRFRPLADGAPAALAAALKAGREALERAEQPAALAAFGRALLIHPGDPAATTGLARSQKLDQVLGGMAEGAAQEGAGKLAAARAAYTDVLKLDPEWTPARAALARIDAGIAAGEFERAMAQGLAALAAGRTGEARTALNRAIALRPGDAGARSGLEQIEGDERRTRLTGMQADADRLAAAERWSEAADQYRGLLKLDATLAAAQSGLAGAEARAELHRRLEQQLANGDHFNDDKLVAVAEAVLKDAEAVGTKGPVLTGQIARLKSLLSAAAKPVSVQFESDNLTNVVIYRVGVLGAFASRAVDLRPGAYVVVGTRDGFRDVRRNIRVDASGAMPPVVVRCEEAI